MKTIGLLGGMSWESTITYYRLINEVVKRELGGLHSAKIVLHSVDFSEVEELQVSEDWDKSAELLTAAAKGLERAGVDFIAICTNTMHKVAPEIEAHIGVPLLHIAQATADVLAEQGITRVALLGTKYTMQQNFYKDKLMAAGIEVTIPSERDMEMVNRVIYEELCQGIVSTASKQNFLRVIADMRTAGAQGAVLGCTEIGLLVQQADTDLPVFDTAQIHAEKIALYALGK